MELVCKKDGFITKFFSCLFIAMFIVFCVVGSFVYGNYDFSYNDINYNFPDDTWSGASNYPYQLIIVRQVGAGTTSDPYNYEVSYNYSNKPFQTEKYNGYIRVITNNSSDSNCYRSVYYYNDNSWTQIGSSLSRGFSVSSNNPNFKQIGILYSSHDIEYNGDIFINATNVERGTGSSSDSGETGNETSGGDTNTTTDSDDSGGFLSGIKEGISNIIQFFKDIIGFIGNILSYLNPLDDNFILKGVIEFLGNILDYLNPFSDNFILKSVLEFLGNALSYINPFSENFFGYKIINLLKSALQWLFVPSEERISALHNTVTSKFDFVTSIKTASDNMKNLIENYGNAPKLKIRTFQTKYTNEQEQVILDFSWYAPYKAYGDVIITGFVYALFFWRLFISVPNIIKGNAGVVNDVEFIKYINSGKG